jgi:RNHCP domain
MNRNHCPFCLFSLHVAESRKQDDRKSTCRELMEPIAISAQKDGEWALVHRCVGCGNIKTNRIAGDDDTLALLCIALRPLESLPFPLDQVLFEAKLPKAA